MQLTPRERYDELRKLEVGAHWRELRVLLQGRAFPLIEALLERVEGLEKELATYERQHLNSLEEQAKQSRDKRKDHGYH